jgi:NADH-quinone oxidoreductase subunit L
MFIVAIIGAATALFAATIGRRKTTSKVLAYSTISQLGYMFLACGVGALSR